MVKDQAPKGIVGILGRIITRDAEPAAVKLSDVQAPIEDSNKTQTPVQFQGRGSSGIRNYHGYLSEDYLHNLHGHQAADIWDKMRRSDSKIKKVLKAVKDPIKAATWEIHAGDTPEEQLHKEFIEHVLFEAMDDDNSFAQFISEALTLLEFGFAPFEKIHKMVLNHPVYGNYVGIQKLAWRSPRTIHRFNVDRNTEQLLSVSQFSYGDLQRLVDIDARFMMVISLDREGSNWEGISALRNCYGAWLRKQTFLKLLAIGIEKYAVPTPIGKVPHTSGDDFNAFVDALERYTSHEVNYITLPEGWNILLQSNPFDPAKVRSAVDAENLEIVDAFIANFLELAMGGGGGGRALSEDLSSFFLSGITQIAYLICDSVNAKVIKDLIDLKFGPQQKYPKLVATGITDKAGIDLANALKALVDSKVIIPDDPLEENVRKRFDFPAASTKGQRQVQDSGGSTPGIGNSPFQSAGLSERQIRLAETTAKSIIAAGGDELKTVMRTGLTKIGQTMIGDLMREAKGKSPAARVSSVKQVDPRGLQEYRQSVRSALSVIAARAIDSARKDVPKAKNVKFAEIRNGITLAEYDNLPSDTKKLVDAQTDLLVTTQAGDLQKAIGFQMTSSAPSTDSDAQLEDDLNGSLEKYVDGASIESGAPTVAAQLTNTARLEFFNDPEVADQIDAFQFVNGDPVSPICQDLAGTIFAANDPTATRYMPPLHHNCKSYIMPILSGNLGSRSIESLKPSRASLDKFVTLSDRAG